MFASPKHGHDFDRVVRATVWVDLRVLRCQILVGKCSRHMYMYNCCICISECEWGCGSFCCCCFFFFFFFGKSKNRCCVFCEIQKRIMNQSIHTRRWYMYFGTKFNLNPDFWDSSLQGDSFAQMFFSCHFYHKVEDTNRFLHISHQK